MTRRLAIMCLAAVFLPGVASPVVTAQGDDPHTLSLKGISALFVMVEPVSDGASKLNVTKEVIQTEVELKLRLAGIRVVTWAETLQSPGQPYLHVNVNVMKQANAANIHIELDQNVLLERNSERAFAALNTIRARKNVIEIR